MNNFYTSPLPITNGQLLFLLPGFTSTSHQHVFTSKLPVLILFLTLAFRRLCIPGFLLSALPIPFQWVFMELTFSSISGWWHILGHSSELLSAPPQFLEDPPLDPESFFWIQRYRLLVDEIIQVCEVCPHGDASKAQNYTGVTS